MNHPSNATLDKLELLLHNLMHDDMLHALRGLRVHNENLQAYISDLDEDEEEDEADEL